MSLLASGVNRPDSSSTLGIGYYGIPVIHEPHWKWLVIGYFFLGGVSGSAAAIGGYAQLFGGRANAHIGRHAAYVSIAALAPCPLLLILDLGRPARFLNMLRAIRTTSPMSVGTWGLTAFGLVSTLGAVLQRAHDLQGHAPRERLKTLTTAKESKLFSSLSCLTGLFVAGYTGVLLAATAVPLWSKRPGLLGALFLASAMTSGASGISASMQIFGAGDQEPEEALLQFESVASIVEGALLVAWINALGSTANPLTQGLMGYVVRHGVVGAGIALPLAISATSSLLPSRFRRAAALASAALTLTGVFALRYAVVEGGRRSANDPVATFEMTR